MKRSITQGFTLAEFLVALVLLAIIATFSISKVLNSSGNRSRQAIMRETVAAINEALYTGVADGSIIPGNPPAMNAYFKNHLNAVRICDDATADGCFYGLGDPNAGAVILPNGAYVLDLDGTMTPVAGVEIYTVVIDWNGPDPPNTIGDDAFVMWGNLGPDHYLDHFKVGTFNIAGNFTIQRAFADAMGG